MPVDAFTVSVVECAGEALVTVSGELDAITCPQLANDLGPVVADHASDVVIDLRDVVFADSTAVHLLTGIGLELRAAGRRLAVRPSPPIERLLSLTGLRAWFEEG